MLFEHFKRAAEYDPTQEKDASGYWAGAVMMLFFSPIPLVAPARDVLDMSSRELLVICAVAAEILALSMVLMPRVLRGRLERTPVPTLWCKSVYWVAFAFGFHVLIVGGLLGTVVRHRWPSVPWIMFGVMVGLAMACIVALTIDALTPRNAKGPAHGEASSSK